MNVHPKKLFPGVEHFDMLNQLPMTKKDLLTFTNILLAEIEDLVTKKEPTPTWLKSSEVRKLLKISPGTLQNLRINGTLNYTRVGGTFYYKYEDIKKLLD